MNQNELWATGITVRCDYDDSGWWAWVDFEDSTPHAHVGAMAGRIGTKYALPTLAAAIDRVLEYARQIGVVFPRLTEFLPTVYYAGDGESDYAPHNWRQLVNAEARRLGWRPIYNGERVVEVK